MPISAGSESILVNQVSLAEFAMAKLKRQQQRILENDASLTTAKPRLSRKPKVEWKPFNLANSSDDNVSLSDSADSRNPTPFDVHAKVFKPSTIDSRESSQSRVPGPSSNARAVPILSEAKAVYDDGGDFQLIQGKKMKPTSRPPLTLNPYQAKPADSVPTVAASYDKKEINEVFGNDLPPPEFVQANPGFKQGQIQFVMHPNGDIAAQQWCFIKYQWTNIGQYSNIRRRREGMLAGSRLRGETEQQSLQQNTLAYFRAVAKQSEALEMGLSWGPKEVNACLPALHIDSTTAAQKIEENMKPPKIPSLQPSAIQGGFSHGIRPLRVNSEASIMPIISQGDSHSSLDSMSFGGFPAASLRDATGTESIQNKDYRQATSGIYSAWPEPAIPLPATPAPYESIGIGTQFQPPREPPAIEFNYHSAVPVQHQNLPIIEDVAAKSVPIPIIDKASSIDRSVRKEYLNKLGETASARGMSAAPAVRTVLHDPLQAESTAAFQGSSLKNTPSQYMRNSTGRTAVPDVGFNPFALRPLDEYDAGRAKARRELLGLSEPDLVPWNARPINVVDVETPCSLNHEQLAQYSRPTPQNWKEPFFVDSPEQQVNKKSYDEDLRDWFMGGNTRARQDEFYLRIKAAHHSTAPRNFSPGPICPPNIKSTPKHRRQESANFNEGMTRLLIPVLENLASYVEGPMEKRHGPFARFVSPPEWCIDRSPNGNKSFFENNWGQPPERIGRDSRYRPMTYEGRERRFGSGGYEHSPTVGALTGLSRSVQPAEGRFQFGPGRKGW